MQKRLAVHRALCPSTLIERRREGKDVVEKSVQAIGITAPWRGLWNKTHSKMWGRFTKSGLQLESVLQEPLRRRMQDMGFSCRIPCVKPLLNNRQRQKRLAWAKDKKDWTAAEWSKVMFSDESKFCISFGNQGPRVWRKRGEAQHPRCLRSSVKFPQSVMVWCWCTVFSEVQGQHSRIPGSFRALHASCCWPTLWRCRFHFPTGLGTCTVPKLPVPGLRTMVSLFLIGQQTRLTITP